MQEHEDAWKPTEMERNPSQFFPRSRLSILVVIIVGIVLLQSDFVPHWGQPGSSRHTVMIKTIATNGANRWIGDRTITAPTFDFSPSDNNVVSISPLFEHYY